jgi:hypothetical protein
MKWHQFPNVWSQVSSIVNKRKKRSEGPTSSSPSGNSTALQGAVQPTLGTIDLVCLIFQPVTWEPISHSKFQFALYHLYFTTAGKSNCLEATDPPLRRLSTSCYIEAACFEYLRSCSELLVLNIWSSGRLQTYHFIYASFILCFFNTNDYMKLLFPCWFLLTCVNTEHHPLSLGRTQLPSGWGTTLQAGRSRVRFTMRSLHFSIDLILPAALWPWDRLSLLT